SVCMTWAEIAYVWLVDLAPAGPQGNREKTVNSKSCSVRQSQIAPLPLHFDIGFVHAPTHPHRTFAAMECFLSLGAVFDDPAVNRGVIHLHPTFFHEFFDMACAQRICHMPAHTHENDLWGEMGPFETDRHRRLPHDAPLLTGEDHTSNRFKE